MLYVRPVTVIALALLPVRVTVMPSGSEVTVYDVIGLPPFSGAVKDTVACPFPLTAFTFVGFPGTVPVLNSKTAPTFMSSPGCMVIERVTCPVPAPVQPLNTKPVSGVAVRTTVSTFLKFALEEELSGPQDMPAGDEVTVPKPRPDLATVSVESVDESGNVTESAMTG